MSTNIIPDEIQKALLFGPSRARKQSFQTRTYSPETPRTTPGLHWYETDTKEPNSSLPNSRSVGEKCLIPGIPFSPRASSQASQQSQFMKSSGPKQDNHRDEESLPSYVLSTFKETVPNDLACSALHPRSGLPAGGANKDQMKAETGAGSSHCLLRSPGSGVSRSRVESLNTRNSSKDDRSSKQSFPGQDEPSLSDPFRHLNQHDSMLFGSASSHEPAKPISQVQREPASFHTTIDHPVLSPAIPSSCLSIHSPKQESCIGIGSWSTDHSLPLEKPQNPLLPEFLPAEIYSLFGKNWLANECPSGHQHPQSSSSQALSSKTQATPGSYSSTSYTSCDVHPLQENHDDEDNDDNDDISKRPGRKSSSGDLESGPKLACPFNKHNPQFFKANLDNGITFRTCAGPGFENIARLKAHLYRIHKTPIVCPICGMLFTSQTLLNAHIVEKNGRHQTGLPGVPWTSINADMEKKLRSKKKSDLGQAERWRLIYGLIFPNEAAPSPYYEHEDAVYPLVEELPDIENNETFSYQELRQVFQNVIHTTLGGPLPKSHDELKVFLVSNFDQCLKEVCPTYHNTPKQGFMQAPLDRRIMDMPTPRAPNNGFEPQESVSIQPYRPFHQPVSIPLSIPAAPVSWQQPSETPNPSYNSALNLEGVHHSQYTSRDLSHSRSDSGYSTNSFCGFSECGGFCPCLKSSDGNRNSYIGSAQPANPPDSMDMNQGSHEYTVGAWNWQNNVLTAIPQSQEDPSYQDFFPLQ